MPLRIQGEMSRWSGAPVLNVGETSCAGHLTERRAGSREREGTRHRSGGSYGPAEHLRCQEGFCGSGRDFQNLKPWETAFDAVSLGGV